MTASIVGNMGAPLRTGALRELGEDAEGIELSEDPFNFGLNFEDCSAEYGEDAHTATSQ